MHVDTAGSGAKHELLEAALVLIVFESYLLSFRDKHQVKICDDYVLPKLPTHPNLFSLTTLI